ncbi:MAG: outer membrane beta-barrel protein [Bryobacterales bacterium]|nr:outer membrane beta-barrel protein [Bryobacterales bacterium]
MRFFLLLSLLVVPAFADAISLGVKLGVPLTDTVRTAGEIGSRPFRADVRSFTGGPIVNVRLPLGLGFEFGALYKRFDQEAGRANGDPFTKTGGSWEFPLVGQLRLPGPIVRPYIEGGVAFNRLSEVLAPFRALGPNPNQAPPAVSETRRGVVLGAGIEFSLPIVRISPGLRYTRYNTAQSWLPGANSIDFLVGITF